MKNEISLALGGGGVRGFAHIGVLHVLQQSGFTVRAIAGTSAGAIVGSLVAAGFGLGEIQNELESIETNRFFQRKPDDLPSILGMQGLEEKLREMLGRKKFNDLNMPFVAVAVNLQTGKSTVLSEGDVVEAVMASSAVPGFFPPRHIAGDKYIDGGVALPVPVAPVRTLFPMLPVVAVALSPSIVEWGNNSEFISLNGALPVLQRFIERSRVAQSISTLLTAVDIGSVMITDLSLVNDPPDILIRPRVFHVGLLEFSKAEPLVTAGEDAAFESLESLRKAVSRRGKFTRTVSHILKKLIK